MRSLCLGEYSIWRTGRLFAGLFREQHRSCSEFASYAKTDRIELIQKWRNPSYHADAFGMQQYTDSPHDGQTDLLGYAPRFAIIKNYSAPGNLGGKRYCGRLTSPQLP